MKCHVLSCSGCGMSCFVMRRGRPGRRGGSELSPSTSSGQAFDTRPLARSLRRMRDGDSGPDRTLIPSSGASRVSRDPPHMSWNVMFRHGGALRGLLPAAPGCGSWEMTRRRRPGLRLPPRRRGSLSPSPGGEVGVQLRVSRKPRTARPGLHRLRQPRISEMGPRLRRGDEKGRCPRFRETAAGIPPRRLRARWR